MGSSALAVIRLSPGLGVPLVWGCSASILVQPDLLTLLGLQCVLFPPAGDA